MAGNMCYCSNTLPELTPAKEEDCNVGCTGYDPEPCGGKEANGVEGEGAADAASTGVDGVALSGIGLEAAEVAGPGFISILGVGVASASGGAGAGGDGGVSFNVLGQDGKGEEHSGDNLGGLHGDGWSGFVRFKRVSW